MRCKIYKVQSLVALILIIIKCQTVQQTSHISVYIYVCVVGSHLGMQWLFYQNPNHRYVKGCVQLCPQRKYLLNVQYIKERKNGLIKGAVGSWIRSKTKLNDKYIEA